MNIPQRRKAHASCTPIYAHLSITDDEKIPWSQICNDVYLNGLPVNLIRPASVVSQACNNSVNVNKFRFCPDLAYLKANMCFTIKEELSLNIPTSKASNAANSSVRSSIKSAGLLSNFPRTVPGECNPHVVLYA